MFDPILEQMIAAVGGAQHKEPEELTELEKVAIAYAAGLAYRTTWTEDGKVRIDIVDPFGIVKIDGKFTVGWRKAIRGDSVLNSEVRE